MAVTFESISTTGTNTGTDVTVNKPTGLAVGDLMLACLDAEGDDNIYTNRFSLAGWTSVNAIGNRDVTQHTGITSQMLSRFAEAADVAASNFTFAWNGASADLSGNIYRISGANPVTTTITSAVGEVDKTSPWTPTVGEWQGGVAGITTTEANSLLIMYVTCKNASQFSGYTVATTNPSWTEDIDTGASTRALAHATYVPAGATGNVTISYVGSGEEDPAVILTAIRPTVATTVTGVAGTLALAGGTTAIKVGVKMVTTAAQLVLTGGSTLVQNAINWLNTSKSSAPTWTNEDKS